jgi:3-deoxy-manno-octulosonate cytidylyltransferase (CMP-KDO synthetase)
VRDERILGVIPARLGSERLPRKPLHPLAGRPLLEWVWRRVSSFSLFNEVVIATDSAEIVAAAEAWGARAVMTSPDHESGSSRIAEVIAHPEYGDYDVVVNVQGDEPFIEESHAAEAAAQVLRGFDIGTVAAPVRTLESWHDSGVVKVVRRADGGALYFSRSPIPHLRGADPSAADLSGGQFLRHIGIYAYRPEVLRQWVELPPSPLEDIERLEQLRALAAGLTIGVGVVESAFAGVDTPADAARAEQQLRAEQAGT